MNLRIVDSNNIIVAFNETTTFEDVDELFKVFSGGKFVHFTVASLAQEVENVILAGIVWESPYLTHTEHEFLGYHTEHELLKYPQDSQHAIFFCARVPQIRENFKNKGTGELSFLTCLMNFAGSLVYCWKQKVERLSKVAFLDAWVVYLHQDVLVPGLAVSLLYYNVLSVGTMMTATLVWKGIPVYVIGIVRGISVIIGIAVTLLYPLLHSYTIGLSLLVCNQREDSRVNAVILY